MILKIDKNAVVIFSDESQGRGISVALHDLFSSIISFTNPIQALNYIKTKGCFLVITDTEFNIIDEQTYLKDLFKIKNVNNYFVIIEKSEHSTLLQDNQTIELLTKPINISLLINKVKTIINN